MSEALHDELLKLLVESGCTINRETRLLVSQIAEAVTSLQRELEALGCTVKVSMEIHRDSEF